MRRSLLGPNRSPAIGRKPAYQAGFRVFGEPQKRRKMGLGQRLGQHELSGEVDPGPCQAPPVHLRSPATTQTRMAPATRQRPGARHRRQSGLAGSESQLRCHACDRASPGGHPSAPVQFAVSVASSRPQRYALPLMLPATPTSCWPRTQPLTICALPSVG